LDSQIPYYVNTNSRTYLSNPWLVAPFHNGPCRIYLHIQAQDFPLDAKQRNSRADKQNKVHILYILYNTKFVKHLSEKVCRTNASSQQKMKKWKMFIACKS